MSAPGNITFHQKPVNTADNVPVITNWNPLIGYMLYQDNIAGLFHFSLILEVYKGTGVVAANLLAKIKQRRNGYADDNNGATQRARAFFDLRDVVNSQLVDTVFDQNQTGIPFETIHKLGVNVAAKPFSLNGNNETSETQIIEIYVRGYQQYADSVTEIPSEDTTPNVVDTLYYMAASLPLMTARDTDDDYIQGTAFNKYNAANASDLFLSDVQSSSGEYTISGNINYVQDADYHTVAFLNDYSNFASDLDKIVVQYYDSSGSTIGSAEVFNNLNTNGGSKPDTETNTDAERLIYFGCGPGNLEAQSLNTDARPSNNAGWAYYTVRGWDGGTANARTRTYYFIKQDTSCKGFKVRRLAWRNSLGCDDYFKFKKKSTQRVEVKRNHYESRMGEFNNEYWYYNNTMRGKKTRQVTAVLKETLNTDWITEQDANLLEKLIMSTDVYIVENADTTYTEPVMITDTSFVKKTVANDKLIQYTIQIEYANPINTNS